MSRPHWALARTPPARGRVVRGREAAPLRVKQAMTPLKILLGVVDCSPPAGVLQVQASRVLGGVSRAEHGTGADSPQRELFGSSWHWCLWSAAQRERSVACNRGHPQL
jgi:hypothetical protein